MVRVSYSEGGAELLDAVGGLWLQLNRHHLERMPRFSGQYAGKTFPARKKEILVKAAGGELRVFLAFLPDELYPKGYCVGLISAQRVGEIESIYVQEECRDQGIGRELLRRTWNWMDLRSVVSKRVEVAWGNREALGFYEKLGLYPRRVVLERPEDESGPYRS
jgi:diamine N-acetyltransferase